MFGLDYLSASLQKNGYDLQHFEDEASAPIWNTETGDMVNSTIPLSKWRKDVHYNNVVIGTYSGGQYNFSTIVTREELKVTRVDIKYDFPRKDGANANKLGASLARRIRNFYLKAKRAVQYNDTGTVSPDPNSPKTWYFGGRGSDYQIRIYSKQNDTEWVLRIELQLRKDLARSAWSIIQPDCYNQELYSKAFAAFELTILEPGIFQIPAMVKANVKLFRGIEQEASSRKVWIRTQVFQACLSHFKETGEDLSLVLYEDMQRHFLALAEKNRQYQEVNQEVLAKIRLLP